MFENVVAVQITCTYPQIMPDFTPRLGAEKTEDLHQIRLARWNEMGGLEDLLHFGIYAIPARRGTLRETVSQQAKGQIRDVVGKIRGKRREQRRKGRQFHQRTGALFGGGDARRRATEREGFADCFRSLTSQIREKPLGKYRGANGLHKNVERGAEKRRDVANRFEDEREGFILCLLSTVQSEI